MSTRTVGFRCRDPVYCTALHVEDRWRRAGLTGGLLGHVGTLATSGVIDMDVCVRCALIRIDTFPVFEIDWMYC